MGTYDRRLPNCRPTSDPHGSPMQYGSELSGADDQQVLEDCMGEPFDSESSLVMVHDLPDFTDEYDISMPPTSCDITELQTSCDITELQTLCDRAPATDDLDLEISDLLSQSTRKHRKRTLTEPSELTRYQQHDLGTPCKSCGHELLTREQPEATYRARYATEKCCGPIKSGKHGGYPVIEITGSMDNLRLWVAVINEKDYEPHPFFQACPAGKRSRATTEWKEGGTQCVAMSLHDQQHIVTLDYVGVIKLKEEEAKKRTSYVLLSKRSKQEQSKFRLLFQIVGSEEDHIVAQAATNSITCIGKDQGPPQIKGVYKVSGDSVTGERQICITGKNFSKGATVVLQMSADAENAFEHWRDEVSEDAIIHSSRETIVCQVPSSMPMSVPVRLKVIVKNQQQISPPAEFTYDPDVTTNCQQHQVVSHRGVESGLHNVSCSAENEVPSVIQGLCDV